MQTLSIPILMLLAVLSCGVVLACDTPVPSPAAPPASACPPNIDSQLVQLVQAPDTAAFAAQTGIPYSGGVVRVIIELRSGLSLAPDPAVEIESQYMNLVQARIAPADICRIAAEPEVLQIKQLVPPVPQ